DAGLRQIKRRLLDLLCCPDCAGDLVLREGFGFTGVFGGGGLTCLVSGFVGPMLRGMARFGSAVTYSRGLGFSGRSSGGRNWTATPAIRSRGSASSVRLAGRQAN